MIPCGNTWNIWLTIVVIDEYCLPARPELIVRCMQSGWCSEKRENGRRATGQMVERSCLTFSRSLLALTYFCSKVDSFKRRRRHRNSCGNRRIVFFLLTSCEGPFVAKGKAVCLRQRTILTILVIIMIILFVSLRFDEMQSMWKYKWVVSVLFLTIPLKRVLF